jgi:hypothetical protein
LAGEAVKSAGQGFAPKSPQYNNREINPKEKRLLTGDCGMLGSVRLNGLPDNITRHPQFHAGGSADK